MAVAGVVAGPEHQCNFGGRICFHFFDGNDWQRRHCCIYHLDCGGGAERAARTFSDVAKPWGFRISQRCFAAGDLGVADVIARSDGESCGTAVADGLDGWSHGIGDSQYVWFGVESGDAGARAECCGSSAAASRFGWSARIRSPDGDGRAQYRSICLCAAVFTAPVATCGTRWQALRHVARQRAAAVDVGRRGDCRNRFAPFGRHAVNRLDGGR